MAISEKAAELKNKKKKEEEEDAKIMDTKLKIIEILKVMLQGQNVRFVLHMYLFESMI